VRWQDASILAAAGGLPSHFDWSSLSRPLGWSPETALDVSICNLLVKMTASVVAMFEVCTGAALLVSHDSISCGNVQRLYKSSPASSELFCEFQPTLIMMMGELPADNMDCMSIMRVPARACLKVHLGPC